MYGAVLDGEVTAAPHGVAASGPSLPLRGPLKVGVLVDLTLTSDAGGHVKCWERIAEAAVGFPQQLDLTVHFIAPDGAGVPRRIELSSSVRFVLMPPVLSTRRFVRRVPDHTDLGIWHPRLARILPNYDVIHTTDAFFCYARTAARFARKRGVPVVSSIHTNTPEYARLTVEHLLGQVLGDGMLYRLMSRRLAFPDRVSRLLERRLHRHLGGVTLAMASYGGDRQDAFGEDNWSGNWHCGVSLRRGFDRALFSPERRDRAWFEARFALPPGHFVVMYAGKLNSGKNVPLLGPAIELARAGGRPIHLFCAGKGDERDALAARLGAAVTLPGVLAQDELARAYASADLFVFPSVIDESGNAAVEALASGLPALLAAGSGVATRMADCPAVRVLPGDAPRQWADAIAELAAMPGGCRELGALARRHIETAVPSWREVVAEDLLPVWRQAAALHSHQAATS
ncbi:MAG TPA: glycosyltransferase [Stellaceae bacterium]|jgi:glycosyltransferase involved in cell wall biosynthesis|nr:glycosyltransferase [Stellaceae bacterium]